MKNKKRLELTAKKFIGSAEDAEYLWPRLLHIKENFDAVEKYIYENEVIRNRKVILKAIVEAYSTFLVELEDPIRAKFPETYSKES